MLRVPDRAGNGAAQHQIRLVLSAGQVIMEYVQTVLARITATRFDEAARPGGLLSELEAHRGYLQTQAGFDGMEITRSANPEGDVLVVVETRWANNNAMADYSTRESTVANILNAHTDLLVPNSVQVHRMETDRPSGRQAPNQVYDRLALAVLIPLGVLALAALVIFGLSRIYLVLPGSAATPMAAGIAIAVLATAWYLATHPIIPRWQIGGMVVVLLALGISGIAASIYDDQTAEKKQAEAPARPTEASPAPGAPTAQPGVPEIDMEDNAFKDAQGAKNGTFTVTGAGKEVSIQIHNSGAATHNVHIDSSGSFDPAAPGICKTTGTQPCSKSVAGAKSGTIAFTLAAGTYDFRCDFHPTEMSGKLVVQ